MNFKKPNKKRAENYERTETECSENKRSRFDELFSQNWEVFVIKKDQTTGKLIGKVACCALAPV